MTLPLQADFHVGMRVSESASLPTLYRLASFALPPLILALRLKPVTVGLLGTYLYPHPTAWFTELFSARAHSHRC